MKITPILASLLSVVVLAVIASTARADAAGQVIHLSQAVVVVPQYAPPPAGFMTGQWLGAPCQMIFQFDDGRSVQGDCATPAGLHHVFRGVYTTPDTITGSVTRIDPYGCQITVPATFHIDDQNNVDYSLPGWYGCGMNGGGAATHYPVTRALPVVGYVPNPYDAYLVNISPTDLMFMGGNTYIWVTDASGNRTQQFYGAGDHRQELMNRSGELQRAAAQNGGHLPAGQTRSNVASFAQPPHAGAPAMGGGVPHAGAAAPPGAPSFAARPTGVNGSAPAIRAPAAAAPLKPPVRPAPNPAVKPILPSEKKG